MKELENALLLPLENILKKVLLRVIDNFSKDNKTPLEIKLNSIADLIGYFGLENAVVALIALVIRIIIEYIVGGESFEFAGLIKKILIIIILCVSIIVVAIPEGLPSAITLSLSFSIQKLMDNNNLVRRMHACETMGGANIICTHKTGTLTKNLMVVTRIVTSNESIEVSPENEEQQIEKKKGQKILKVRNEHNTIIQNDEYWDILIRQ